MIIMEKEIKRDYYLDQLIKRKDNRLIKPVLENFKSQTQVSKETGINVGLIFQWIKKYNEKGMEGLKNKTKPGNPLSKYSNKKNLTKEERIKDVYALSGQWKNISEQEAEAIKKRMARKRKIVS